MKGIWLVMVIVYLKSNRLKGDDETKILFHGATVTSHGQHICASFPEIETECGIVRLKRMHLYLELLYIQISYNIYQTSRRNMFILFVRLNLSIFDVLSKIYKYMLMCFFLLFRILVIFS